MILLVFLVFFEINNLSFENFKELDLNDELISQPKLLENNIFLFFEKKVTKLNLNTFGIENFFEGDKYNISENGIIFEKGGEKFLLSFAGNESKTDMENRGLKSGKKNDLEDFINFKDVKKTFVDEDFIYVETENNFLNCIRKKDLKRLWEIKIPSDILALISDKKRVYILCGSSIVLSIKRKGGDIIWWRSVKERCFSGIRLINGYIIVSHRRGVQFLRTENGTLDGTLEIPINFAPVLFRDYIILFQLDKVLIYEVKK